MLRDMTLQLIPYSGKPSLGMVSPISISWMTI